MVRKVPKFRNFKELSDFLQDQYWFAVGFYESEGYSPKKAESLAWRDLKLDFPKEMRRFERGLRKRKRKRR